MNVIKDIAGLGVGAIAPDSIVNADCLEAMKLIADKSVDAIVLIEVLLKNAIIV